MHDSADRLRERVLVARCRTGDETAFAEIVAIYSPKLRYYLRKMLGRVDRADDILQDVWLDVFRGVPRLAHVEAFGPWLYRIARHRALGNLRKKQSPALPLNDDALIDEGTTEVSFTAEDAEQIHAALDTLAAEHREVLILRFLEELTYEEMAQVIGCPIGTVRSRVHYAKQALRSTLERTIYHERERNR